MLKSYYVVPSAAPSRPSRQHNDGTDGESSLAGSTFTSILNQPIGLKENGIGEEPPVTSSGLMQENAALREIIAAFERNRNVLEDVGKTLSFPSVRLKTRISDCKGKQPLAKQHCPVPQRVPGPGTALPPRAVDDAHIDANVAQPVWSRHLSAAVKSAIEHAQRAQIVNDSEQWEQHAKSHAATATTRGECAQGTPSVIGGGKHKFACGEQVIVGSPKKVQGPMGRARRGRPSPSHQCLRSCIRVYGNGAIRVPDKQNVLV